MTQRCQNCDCTVVFSVQGMYTVQSQCIVYRELHVCSPKIRVHYREKGYGEGGFGGLARPPHTAFLVEGKALGTSLLLLLCSSKIFRQGSSISFLAKLRHTKRYSVMYMKFSTWLKQICSRNFDVCGKASMQLLSITQSSGKSFGMAGNW